MLIIKSEPNSLKGVEQFLRNRDWSLSSTHQMKDAILFLTKNKPSFVLITVDHTNPKIRKLPKIVTSAFPCCVMVYAEKSTTSSFKLLMDSGIEYKINPPVTGPAIERAVNKFIRDQEQAAKHKTQEQNNENAKNSFEFKVEIKGGERDNSSSTFQTSVSSNGSATEAPPDSLALSLLAQLNNADMDSSREQNSGGGQTIGGMGSSQKPKNPNGEVLNFKKDNPKNNQYSASESEIALEKGAKKKQAKGAGSFDINSGEQESSGDENSSENGNGANAAGFLNGNGQKKRGPAGDNQHGDDFSEGGTLGGPSQKARGSVNINQNEQDPNSDSSKSGSGYFPKNQKGQADISIGKAQSRSTGGNAEGPNPETPEDIYVPPVNGNNNESNPEKPQEGVARKDILIGKEIDELSAKRKENADSLVIKKSGLFEKDSVFVKGVNQALDDTAVKNDGVIKTQLEDNSHLACIIVESVRFSGYLVAALGKDKKIDDQFVDLVRMKLAKFLVDNGEPMDNDANMQIKVRRVDFEGWALEYAQFLRKSVHKGDEVAMAFFPFAEAKTNIGKSADANMVSVKTEEIQTGVALEFNMYIYLPSNKKYILYTPEGGKFLAEQKARLTRQGVTNMHIQKDDVQNLGKFKAQNHLNSLINEFEDKKSDPAKTKKKKSA